MINYYNRKPFSLLTDHRWCPSRWDGTVKRLERMIKSKFCHGEWCWNEIALYFKTMFSLSWDSFISCYVKNTAPGIIRKYGRFTFSQWHAGFGDVWYRPIVFSSNEYSGESVQMFILASAFAAHTQNIGVNEDSGENFDLYPLWICVSRAFKRMRYDDGCQKDMVGFVISDDVMESLNP